MNNELQDFDNVIEKIYKADRISYTILAAILGAPKAKQKLIEIVKNKEMAAICNGKDKSLASLSPVVFVYTGYPLMSTIRSLPTVYMFDGEELILSTYTDCVGVIESGWNGIEANMFRLMHTVYKEKPEIEKGIILGELRTRALVNGMAGVIYTTKDTIVFDSYNDFLPSCEVPNLNYTPWEFEPSDCTSIHQGLEPELTRDINNNKKNKGKQLRLQQSQEDRKKSSASGLINELVYNIKVG